MGEGDALDEDEVEETTKDDAGAEAEVVAAEEAEVEEPEAAATELEMVDEVEFATNTCVVIGALNLYIWRRLPAPQYSVVLPGQSMLQSAWFGTKALPAFGLDPQ